MKNTHSITGILLALCVLLLSCLLDGQLHARQIWDKELSENSESISLGRSVIETKDGGFFVVGCINCGFSNQMGVAYKTTSTGEIVWSKSFDNCWFRACQQNRNGDFIAVGLYGADIGAKQKKNGICIQLSDNGDVLWEASVESDISIRLTSATLMSNGDYLVAGNATINEPGNSTDCLVSRIDTNGKILWTKTITLPGYQEIADIDMVDDHSMIAVGRSNQEGKNAGYLVVKMSDDGEVVQTNISDNENAEELISLNVSKGTITALGVASSKTDKEMHDISLNSLSTQGEIINNVLINPLPDDLILEDLIRGNNECYTIVGSVDAHKGKSDILVIEVEDNGEVRNLKRIKTKKASDGFSITRTGDGGYVICGDVGNTGIGSEVYLVKIAGFERIE